MLVAGVPDLIFGRASGSGHCSRGSGCQSRGREGGRERNRERNQVSKHFKNDNPRRTN